MLSNEKEKDLEEELINTLVEQGYEYDPGIHKEAELRQNLRKQLERLNSKIRNEEFKFTDKEWYQFYEQAFKGEDNEGIENRIRRIHGDRYRVMLRRENGNFVNIDLIDKREVQNNYLQVINQYSDYETKRRYDVTILVNGLPLIHIEMKRRGISIEDAFYQIEKYRDDSFQKLFEFVQIFIITNGTETKYYSNTTSRQRATSGYKFTSYWANEKNEHIKDLMLFAKTFLHPSNVVEMLTKFCVFYKNDKGISLKVLRPYQITAINKILKKIRESIALELPIEKSCGYIWHTTGSGKTLTSFKAAQLAKEIPEVKKVMFVVDRKDLDAQTIQEYQRYLGESTEENINETSNTKALLQLLNDNEKRIIVTTIQKLRRLIDENEYYKFLRRSLFEERIVIIMDECHRTQSKDVHDKIKENFKKLNIFGFTGTPILKRVGKELTTKELFEEELHTYKIAEAMRDGNVLDFWIDYVGNKKGWIKNADYNSEKWIEKVVDYIIREFYTKTNPNPDGRHDFSIKSKFNSILAVESISMAIDYYREFEKQLEEKNRKLDVAIIYSANLDVENKKWKEEEKSDDAMTTSQKEFYEEVKAKYEAKIGSRIYSYNDYRARIANDVKEREIDLLIVVNMFLTGFDALRLNTLWVDKNLSDHNLIQAFSRTNRIFNETKRQGNIICFRDLIEATNTAFHDFADDNFGKLNNFDEDIKDFWRIEDEMLTLFPVSEEIQGEKRQMDFIDIYREYLNKAQRLSCYEEFESHRKIGVEQREDYKIKYLNIWDQIKNREEKAVNERPKHSPTPKNEEVTHDFELVILWQELINKEWFIENKLNKFKPNDDKTSIMRKVDSDPELRKEKNIIEDFLERRNKGEEIDYLVHKKEWWELYIDQVIEELGLNREGTKNFVREALEEKNLDFKGEGKTGAIMPPNIKVRQEPKKLKEIWLKAKERISEFYEIFKDINI